MYRSGSNGQLEFPDFYLPFSGHLDPDNRWVAMAKRVPWELAEEIYQQALCEDVGAPSLPARLALGALLIKERLGLTDRETVEAIQENPYTVEGKFGQGKRCFGLARIMAKLASTSAARISLTFLVMNLELALRRFFLSLFFVCYCSARRLEPAPSPAWQPSRCEFTTRRHDTHGLRALHSLARILLAHRWSTKPASPTLAQGKV